MIRAFRPSNRQVLILGVVVLAVGALAGLWPRGEAPSRPGPRSSGPTAAPAPAAPVFSGRLQGRVVDGRDQGLGGVAVQLVRLGPAGASGAPYGGTTGPDGGFAVVVARPGTYRMMIEAAGRARQVRRVVVLAPGVRDLGLLRLGRDEPIHGLVTAASGPPLGAVVVTAVSALSLPGRPLEPPHLAVTNPQGRFRLVGLPAGTYRVRAAAAGYSVSVLREVRTPALGVRFKLRPLRGVGGRVLRKGTPVKGATVSLVGSGAWPPRRVRTDEQGRFRFGDLREGIYELQAREGTWVSRPSAPVDILGAGPPPTVILHLLEGVIISGRVLDDATGKGLHGARLIASVQALAFNPRHTRTDGLGAFHLGPLLPGEYRVTVEQEGYLPKRGVALTVLPLSNPPLEVRLRRGAVLAGQVIDDTGRAVVGARLELVGRAVGSYIADRGVEAVHTQQALWNQLLRALSKTPAVDPEPVSVRGSLGVLPGPIPLVPGADQLGDLTGATGVAPAAGFAHGFVTDKKGRFRIRGVPPGTLALVVRHEDFVRHRTPPIRLARGAPGREDLLVRLRPGIALEGEIVDGVQAPVSAVEVAVSSADDPFHHVFRTADARGRFRIPHLMGSLRVSLRAAGFVPQVVRVQLGSADGPRKRVRWTLSRASCTLSGWVQDRRKIAVSGVRLTVESLTPDAPSRAVAVSDDKGAFRVTGLGRLLYQVTVTHPDHPVHRFQRTCPSAPVRWTLGYGGGVSFEVRDKQTGSPVPAFHYTLRRPGAAPRQGDGSAGRAQEVPLEAGRYLLRVRSPGYATAEQELRVAAAAHPRQITRRGVVVWLRRAGSVAGWVRDDRGLAVAGARVRIAGREGGTDAQGRFLVGDVPVGQHPLEVDHPTRGRGRLPEVSVRAGLQTAGLVVDLEPGAADPKALTAGLAMGVGERGGRLVVTSVTRGSLVEKGGVVAGDELVSVDGRDLDGLGVGDVLSLLRGAAGTPVVLELQRAGQRLKRVVRRELLK